VFREGEIEDLEADNGNVVEAKDAPLLSHIAPNTKNMKSSWERYRFMISI
jgi:hypothetical protein